MPVYNERAFVSESIKSVLSQTFADFEYIIVDDNSDDGTAAILRSFAKKDKRIKLLNNAHRSGVGASINKAILRARGSYIARMDADDVMEGNRLEEQLYFMKENPDTVCSGSWMREIDEKGKVIGFRKPPSNHGKIYETMYFSMGIQNPTLMINRGLVPEGFSWCKTDGILDDLDLLFKLLRFGKFANTEKYLMKYRIHGNNLSLTDTKKTFKEANIIRKNAEKKYGYKPSFKGKTINCIESLIVFLLPEKMIYPVYKLFNNGKFI